MAKCKQCGTEYEAKRSTSSYCGPKCKQEFYRNRIPKSVTVSPESVTLRDAKSVTVTKGKCWCCGATIAKILVCCQECAWSGRAAAKRAGAYPPLLTDRTPDQMHTDLHTLRPTGNHKMTVMERLFYRPASQLLSGQTNFVSLPGRACYGVYDGRGYHRSPESSHQP